MFGGPRLVMIGLKRSLWARVFECLFQTGAAVLGGCGTCGPRFSLERSSSTHKNLAFVLPMLAGLSRSEGPLLQAPSPRPLP